MTATNSSPKALRLFERGSPQLFSISQNEIDNSVRKQHATNHHKKQLSRRKWVFINNQICIHVFVDCGRLKRNGTSLLFPK
jgi:hypothetical protein